MHGPELPRQCLSPVLQHNGQVPQSAGHQEESNSGEKRKNNGCILTHTPLSQLVAAATMFIASKLADPCPITGTELVRYTNDTYNLTELLVSLT